MDIPHVSFPLAVRYYQRGDENRRDTIMVRTRPVSEAERKKWLGAPPTPLPETDRNFRPSEVKF